MPWHDFLETLDNHKLRKRSDEPKKEAPPIRCYSWTDNNTFSTKIARFDQTLLSTVPNYEKHVNKLFLVRI
jgi:hypothetical protein